jgi:hypothetical protein
VPIGSAKPLSSISRSAGSQVRVICIPAMFPISTTMQSLIDAWEEDFSEGVENLGWELDDNEVYFHGELELEKAEG